jgi:hypothetical protein
MPHEAASVLHPRFRVKTMNMQRIVGIVLLVVGVILFIVGMNGSDSVSDRLSNFFTGHFSDVTVWYLVGGVASIIGGLMLVTFGGSKALA